MSLYKLIKERMLVRVCNHWQWSKAPWVIIVIIVMTVMMMTMMGVNFIVFMIVMTCMLMIKLLIMRMSQLRWMLNMCMLGE